MAKVVYRGPDDIRELGPNDFKGVDLDKTLVFHKGHEVEVNMTVALMLVTEPDRYGQFFIAEPDSLEDKPAEKRTTPSTESSSSKKHSKG